MTSQTVPRTVLTGARLIDGISDTVVPDAAVVIEGGVFVYAGPAATRPSGVDEAVFDLAGRTVLPGFFDCHVHFLMDSNADFTGTMLKNRPVVNVFQRVRRMRDTLHAGITTARDLGGTDAGYRDAVELGLVDGPRLHVALRLMSHTGGHADFRLPSGFDPSALLGPFSEIVDSPDEVRAATRRLIREGADVIKVCATGGVNSPSDHPEDEGLRTDEIALIADEVRRHRGLPIAAHAQGAQGIKNALRGGATSIEHGYLIDDEGIDLMLERDAFLVPTLSTFDLDPSGYTPQAWAKKQRMADAAVVRLSEAVRRGVKIALGTDSGIAPHGRNLRELAHLVKLGMSPLDAIRAGTIQAAALLGVADRLGSVTAGKIADLVVCEGDPLADIGVLGDPGNISVVIQGGVVKKGSPARSAHQTARWPSPA
ncbi:hydrolase [Amycolatopsis deserti]|uniref:Hydrolase n=1 Tax=Amycolatopsis deserti TaxID=185696 RepID=A0ABQ3IKF0_9PSEU|nr:amidohydrolase family protein [Amycolatopsis deserti]GHE84043.1 hydrolase [Amycolatopsis deserti]